MAAYVYNPVQGKGSLALCLYSEKGDKVWENVYPAYTENSATGEMEEDLTLIELGAMKSCTDTEGLKNHLVEIGVVQPGDSIMLKK